MKKIIFILISFFILICFSLFFVWQGIYSPKDITGSENEIFSIEKGQGVFEIAENLENQELIKNKIFFGIYVILKGETGKLQAGKYLLSSEMSICQIAEKFVSGDIIKEKIIIIEGWNLRDIGFYFENKGMFQAEEIWELAGFPAVDYSKAIDLPKPKDFSQYYDFLKEKPKNTGLEGYLFPDTYFISGQEAMNNEKKIEKIIQIMLDNFDKKLAPYRNEVSGTGLTLFQIVTMASLLEKEVKTFEDKQMVSGILWKRLNIGMPLQVDATISYITGKNTTSISKQETQIDSPYNTYKYLGLPAGPICNPGLDSIKAAIYPKTNAYWYYLSTQEGETIFSKTLEEHNIAKAKYLKNSKNSEN